MFTSVSARSASAYKKASVEASVDLADPHQLVVLLFDALQRHLNMAKIAMESKDIVTKCTQIGNAISILEEGLRAPLDLQNGGEIAANLDNLYAYCVTRLVAANLRNDKEAVEEVGRLIEPIASGWKQIKGNGPAYLRPI